MNTKHAVISRTHLMIGEGRSVRKIALSEPCTTISDACDLALAHKITHIWPMPDIEMYMGHGDDYNVFATYEDDENTRPMFARVYRKGTYGEVKIGFPGRGRWEWQIDAPTDILASITYLEEVLGVPVEWSPGHMGTELVIHLNRTERRQAWVRECTIDLGELPFKRAARDVVWKAGDVRFLKPGLYIHQVDKRSAYLSSCPGVYVGAGDPVHTIGPCDISLVGVYRVTLKSMHVLFDGAELPPIINTEWVTGDVLKYALDNGYEVEVHEAWQWNEKHKALESYAAKLWKSRRAFREDLVRFPHQIGRENAESTMKQVALVSTGKFAYKSAGRFKRPDWWAMVVGKTRTNVLRNMYSFYMKGWKSALVYSDSVYLVSDKPDIRDAFPGILDREKESGGYRHEGTWEITLALIEAFKTMTPGAIQKLLEHTPKVEVQA